MGAITTTVKHGNSVINSVSQRTNGVVGVSNINITLSGVTNTTMWNYRSGYSNISSL